MAITFEFSLQQVGPVLRAHHVIEQGRLGAPVGAAELGSRDVTAAVLRAARAWEPRRRHGALAELHFGRGGRGCSARRISHRWLCLAYAWSPGPGYLRAGSGHRPLHQLCCHALALISVS